MKILVLGAGAVGGLVGGRLAQAGADVTFLVRERRLGQLQAKGLVIDSPAGDAVVRVQATTPEQVEPVHDLVILTCKAWDLEPAIDAIRPAMSADAAVLPLLNGLAHIDRLNACFGQRRVIGGTIRVQATLTGEGVIRQFNDWQAMIFGEQDGAVSQRLSTLKALLDATPVSATVSTNILREMWLKLVHLSTVAAMTCTMRANLGEIVRTPEGSALLKRLFATNCAIAAHFGHPPDEKFVRTYTSLFEDASSPYESSMMRDLEKGGPIESDQILGYMLDRCREAGQPDTLHLLAYTHAKAYEQRRAAGRLPGRVSAA
jgi:2-dehydropantoate 2-reductase